MAYHPEPTASSGNGEGHASPEVEEGRSLRLPLWEPCRLDADEWVLVFPGGYVLRLEKESDALRR